MAATGRLSYYFVGLLLAFSAWAPHQAGRHFHIRAQSSSGPPQARAQAPPNLMEAQEERQQQLEEMRSDWLAENEQQAAAQAALQQQQLDGLVRTAPSPLEHILREWQLDNSLVDDSGEQQLQITRRRTGAPPGRRLARPASFVPGPTSPTTMRTPAFASGQDALAEVETSFQRELLRGGGPGRGAAHQTTASPSGSSGPTTGERKRRMLSMQPNMLRRLMTPADQLNAIQSLGISLDGGAFARVYKPKIMSTARGFGK